MYLSTSNHSSVSLLVHLDAATRTQSIPLLLLLALSLGLTPPRYLVARVRVLKHAAVGILQLRARLASQRLRGGAHAFLDIVRPILHFCEAAAHANLVLHLALGADRFTSLATAEEILQPIPGALDRFRLPHDGVLVFLYLVRDFLPHARRLPLHVAQLHGCLIHCLLRRQMIELILKVLQLMLKLLESASCLDPQEART